MRRNATRNPYDPLGLDAPSSVAHALCREHVPMEGFRYPVCIQKGQDRATILAEAAELTGLPTPIRGRGKGAGTHGTELSHPTPRTRRPIGKGTPRRVGE